MRLQARPISRLASPRGLRWQVLGAEQEDRQADQHANAGRAKAIMPADVLAERSDHQGRGDHTEVDGQIKDLKRIGPPRIVFRVKRADLARDISLEAAVAEDEAQQGE